MSNRICPKCSEDNQHHHSDYCERCGHSLNASTSILLSPIPEPRELLERPPDYPRVRNSNMVRGRVEFITERYLERRGWTPLFWSIFATTIVLVLLLAIVGQIAQSPRLITQIIISIIPIALIWFLFSMLLGLVGFGGKRSLFESLPNLFILVGGLFNIFRYLFDFNKGNIPITSIQIISDEDSQLVNIEIRGTTIGGAIQIGNEIEVYGTNKRGTIEFKRGTNISTRAAIRVRKP